MSAVSHDAYLTVGSSAQTGDEERTVEELHNWNGHVSWKESEELNCQIHTIDKLTNCRCEIRSLEFANFHMKWRIFI